MIFIFDIDGTLADLQHRLHFIQQDKPDWRAFFAACGDDLPIKEVIEVARCLGRTHSIFLLTGRSDEIEEQTMNWLRDFDVPFEAVYMRKEGDHREDSIVKSELLDEFLSDWRESITESGIGGVFDDRQQVVDMYRKRGLRVFQVADGKF